MRLENVDQKTLRKKYTDFIALSGKSKSTANTTANYVFKLWNKRGAAFFWDVIKRKMNMRQNVIGLWQ